MPCNNCQASTNVPCGGLTPNDICNGKYTASDCVIYAGVNLSTIDTVNGDTFTAVVNNINDALNNIVVGAFTANNGLTKNTSTNVQLGGTLLQDTTINADTYLLDITGIDPIVFQVKNTATGVAGYFEATGVAGYFESAANSAVVAQSTNGPAVYALTNGSEWAIYGITKVNGNNIEPIIVAARAIVSGSVSVGLGASIDTRLTRESSNAMMTNGSSIITYWSAVVPDFESTWELHTVTTNTLTKKMTMLSTGQLTLDNYTASTSFASASGPSVGLLNVDNAGNVFVVASSSGGFTTADNGLTASTSINAQLGSTTNSGSPLLHDTYINTDSLYTLFFNGSITGAGSRVVDIANTSTGGSLKVTSSLATEPTVLISSTLNPNITALQVTGNGSSTYAAQIANSSGGAMYATSNGSWGITCYNSGIGGTAVYGAATSINGNGAYFTGGATGGYGLLAASVGSSNQDINAAIKGIRYFNAAIQNTPLVLDLQRQRLSTEVPVDGIGLKVDFTLPVSNSLSPTESISNTFISKFTTVDYNTRTSRFIIQSQQASNTIDSLTLYGEGATKLVNITATSASAITAADGMIIYVATTNGTFTTVGFWGYEAGTWVKL